MFPLYDLTSWHEGGVVLPPRTERTVRAQRRPKPWKAALVLVISPAATAPLLTTSLYLGSSTHLVIDRETFRYAGNPHSNPDVLPQGYWSRFDKKWTGLRPFQGDGKEDPDPVF